MTNQFIQIEGVEVVTADSLMEKVEVLLSEVKQLRKQYSFWEMLGNYDLMNKVYQEITVKEEEANKLFELACSLAQ